MTELTTAEVLANPGLLKLELMAHGLRLSPEAADAIRPLRPVGHAFGNTSDLDLILPRDTWVSVPTAIFARRSPYLLRPTADGAFEVTRAEDEASVRVTVQPPAAFYGKRTSTGVPLGTLGTIHGSYLALSPTNECRFVATADQCHFCSIRHATGPDARVPVEDIVEAVRLAREDQRVEMVYLTIGWDPAEDGGVRILEPYIRALKKAFDVLVAVDALPPRTDAWIDRTYAMGVDSISYNLEIFDPELFRRICPGPSRTIGRDRFLDALGYATTVFSAGAVICHLIAGLEPIASTLTGVEALTRRKVVPVLPLYRPFRGLDMRRRDLPRPTTAELSTLYAALYKALRKERINMRWVRQLSVVTTPLEGRFFVENETWLQAVLGRLVGTRGRSPSVLLSDWRRALRVKEVDDSLTSSGL